MYNPPRAQTFLLYFHACPFYSSCFLASALCHSGSVRFLGVVLPFLHTQQPQCCSRLVHVISNPLQLEWASVGMKRGRQTASLPRERNPFPLLTHHKTGPRHTRVCHHHAACSKVGLSANKIPCGRPGVAMRLTMATNIQLWWQGNTTPVWFVVWRCDLTHTSVTHQHFSDFLTKRVYNSTCLD